jgi:hypothetical protein
MIKKILLAMLLSVSVLTFSADTPPQPPPAQPQSFVRGGGMMMMMDANKDGKVSKDEMLAWFAKVDTNKDGFLSQKEISIAQEAYRGNRPGRGPR